jgi:hypothetical protein
LDVVDLSGTESVPQSQYDSIVVLIKCMSCYPGTAVPQIPITVVLQIVLLFLSNKTLVLIFCGTKLPNTAEYLRRGLPPFLDSRASIGTMP